MSSAPIDWTPVEDAEKQGGVPSLQIALVEAAKILEHRLAEEKVPGATAAERVEAAGLHLTRPNDVKAAHQYVEALRHGQTPGLTEERAKRHLQSFRQAVADVNELTRSRDSIAAQAKLYLGLLKGKQRWVLRAGMGLGVFLLSVVFLADTGWGNLLVLGVVDIVHFFFGWLVGLLIFFAVLIAVILGTAIYLDRQGSRGGRIKDESDEPGPTHDNH